MAAGTISPVAVLRDARIEIDCCRFRHFWIAEVEQARLRCGLLRTRLTDDTVLRHDLMHSHLLKPLERKEQWLSISSSGAGGSSIRRSISMPSRTSASAAARSR